MGPQYKLQIDPYNYTFKQVGIKLIPKGVSDILRSLKSDCSNKYGFDEADGPIIAIWHVRWKVYFNSTIDNNLKVKEG